MKNLIEQMIQHLGDDPTREGLIKTPHRVEKAWHFLSKGYREDPDSIVNNALFHAEDNEMIIIKDIEFYSMCEHHMLPFYGKCHIAYIPDKTIMGLSNCKNHQIISQNYKFKNDLLRKLQLFATASPASWSCGGY